MLQCIVYSTFLERSYSMTNNVVKYLSRYYIKCTVTCQRRDSRIFTEMGLEKTKKEDILLTVNEIETKLDELNLKHHEKDT